eukprot:GAHX01000636.1.p1 GENE.GAHX01000636.1~~GAHX01000636.1.p1  ORF type:complete len:519 (+),score=83.05 GAHX01000636.1:41-1597(+)
MQQEFTVCLSNRPPFTLYRDNTTGAYIKQLGAGGLAAGLSGISDILFIGVMPLVSEPIPVEESLKHGLYPIYIDEHDYKTYYNCVSNEILWPWLHEQDIPIQSVKDLTENFKVYEAVNKTIATEVNKFILSDSFLNFLRDRINIPNMNSLYKSLNLWIHDYHLFLVPSYLRALNKKLKMGFFLHVPFPSCHLAKVLPCASEIAMSLTSVNLLGFHCAAYTENYIEFCKMKGILPKTENGEVDVTDVNLSINKPSLNTYIKNGMVKLRKIPLNGKELFIGDIPIGINAERLKTDRRASMNRSIPFKSETKDLDHPFIFLGVERRDTIKGILHKLEAFEIFLHKYPELIGKVKLIQVVVPSRQKVPVVDKLHNNICRTVGRINGEFGDETYTPIHLINRSIHFNKLVHLYKNSDAIIISSTRDGYNLVCAEYIAAQAPSNPGVVLLSSYTGIYNLVKKGVLEINPYNFDTMIEQYYNAYNMDIVARKSRYDKVKWVGEGNVAQQWAATFLALLDISCKLG